MKKMENLNSSQRLQKITELLSKFKHGEELYKRNAMFNQAIQMMMPNNDKNWYNYRQTRQVVSAP